MLSFFEGGVLFYFLVCLFVFFLGDNRDHNILHYCCSDLLQTFQMKKNMHVPVFWCKKNYSSVNYRSDEWYRET